MTPLRKIGNVPFDMGVLSSMYPKVRHINEKARRLEGDKLVIRLKRGLYVASPDESGRILERNLIANHLYGPSYVSFLTALRDYGLIPERVHLVQSMTTKHKRCFLTPIYNFRYENCSPEYFPIGVVPHREDGVTYLIASPEKALCDLINYTSGLVLRSKKDVECYLDYDMRFDMDALQTFDITILQDCEPFSRKRSSINTLIKFIEHERLI